MRFHALVCSLLACLAAAAPRPAQAQPAADPVPSAFAYGFQGFVVGAGVGLAAGYLVARRDGFERGDWRPLTYGAGVGALAGGALGLTLGLVDMSQGRQGGGYIVMRDAVLGTGFGATAGAIAGGLAVISTRKAEHILLGASIGALAGTAFGAVLGVIEAGRLTAPARPVALTLAPVVSADGSLVWGPALAARY
jgi:hypothetical protein